MRNDEVTQNRLFTIKSYNNFSLREFRGNAVFASLRHYEVRF